jgi:murein hydrolase activator
VKKSCAEGAAPVPTPRVRAPRGPGRRGGPGRPGRCLLAALLLAVVFASPARPQAGPDEMGDRQRQLNELKGQIEENRREIEKLRSKERDLSRLQERIHRDGDLTARYLRELRAKDDLIRSDLASRQADLFDKEAALRETGARLRRGLVRYYKMRRVAGPELIFSSRTFGELFARSQFLARLVYRERLDLEALAEERRALAQGATVLENRRREVESVEGEKRREEERLRRQGAAALVQLGELRDERADREREVKQLEESQTAIRRMLDRLEKDRARARERGAPPVAAGDLATRKKRLPWPVRGSVVSEFGFEVHPRYGTRVPQNGIDIAAPEGTPIQAVAAGSVVYVDWLPGYGRTVILDHGGGFYTLYAHASGVSVHRGESVKGGQTIAQVGDTDSVRGTCVHFEVRQGEKALNPREWLE